MARVTLEGSVTPSTFLARGKRMTVERTPFIDKLIRRGYVNVVEDPDAKTEVESITAPKLVAAKNERKVRATRSKPKPEPEPEPELPFDKGGILVTEDPEPSDG